MLAPTGVVTANAELKVWFPDTCPKSTSASIPARNTEYCQFQPAWMPPSGPSRCSESVPTTRKSVGGAMMFHAFRALPKL
jgi:hypothetical protein